MTDEELKKLAKEYSESVCPADAYDTKEERDEELTIEYDFALPVLRWLTKDHCIVSCEEVITAHTEHMSKMKRVSSARAINRAKAIALEQIFGTEIFKDIK